MVEILTGYLFFTVLISIGLGIGAMIDPWHN